MSTSTSSGCPNTVTSSLQIHSSGLKKKKERIHLLQTGPSCLRLLPNIKELPLCSGVSILIGLQLLSGCFPLNCSSSSPLLFSQALIIPVRSSLHHPSLLSEPEALSPSQAVSPHLCPPSSHQYPSTSHSSRKQSDPSVCHRHSASRLSGCLSHWPAPVGKHDPCFDHPLVILSLLYPRTSLCLSRSLSSPLLYLFALSASIPHPSVRPTLLISSLR